MSDKLSDKLSDCPFCYVSIEEVEQDFYAHPENDCFLGGCEIDGEEEIRKWNRRASPAPAIPAANPVAIVESWTNGSYHRNYKLRWLKNVEAGVTLYTAAPSAPPISESEDALLTAARRAIPALAHAAERNPAYQRDYEELSKAIEDAARKGGKS